MLYSIIVLNIKFFLVKLHTLGQWQTVYPCVYHCTSVILLLCFAHLHSFSFFLIRTVQWLFNLFWFDNSQKNIFIILLVWVNIASVILIYSWLISKIISKTECTVWLYLPICTTSAVRHHKFLIVAGDTKISTSPPPTNNLFEYRSVTSLPNYVVLVFARPPLFPRTIFASTSWNNVWNISFYRIDSWPLTE